MLKKISLFIHFFIWSNFSNISNKNCKIKIKLFICYRSRLFAFTSVKVYILLSFTYLVILHNLFTYTSTYCKERLHKFINMIHLFSKVIVVQSFMLYISHQVILQVLLPVSLVCLEDLCLNCFHKEIVL